jgi:hypothetical protein
VAPNHRPASHAVVGRPIQVSAAKPAGDSVAVGVVWTATGGTIDESGLYTAEAAGVYQVVAQTPDGRLADTATVIVMPPPETPAVNLAGDVLGRSHSPASSEPFKVDVGAPLINVDCQGGSDFIRIDRGWLIMFASSSRQIRIGGCYHGRPISSAYANASNGSLTNDLHYRADALPGIVTIEAGSKESTTLASKKLLVIPDPFHWAFLLWLWQAWRSRRRRPPPPSDHSPIGESERSFREAWNSARRQTLDQFQELQRSLMCLVDTLRIIRRVECPR